MARSTTIGGYLVTRLEQMGLRHIFGVPGDYVLSFYDQLDSMDCSAALLRLGKRLGKKVY